MISIRKITNKTLKYLVILTFMISGGYFAYAQFFAEAYVVRTVHIFPAEISGDGWNNLETLTFQNLEEYALLQEFNTINSATMITSAATLHRLEQVDRESEQTSEEETETQATPTDATATENAPEEASTTTAEMATSTVESEPSTTTPVQVEFDVPQVDEVEEEISQTITNTSTPNSVETNDEAETEVINSTESDEETGTTTVMRQVTSLFRLAVETVTTFTNNPTTSDENLDTEITLEPVEETVDVSTSAENPVSADEVVETELETEENVEFTVPVTEAISTNQTDATEDATSSPEAVTDGAPSNTATTSEEDLAPVTPTSSETVNETSVDEAANIEPVSTTTVVAFEDCEEECRPYIISLNNFTFPLDAGVDITGAQLRMSFAASKKDTRERTPAFSVRYSVDGGVRWEDSGVVVIDDEVSNSVNGGYYLFATPQVVDQNSLNSLQVELVYRDDPRMLEELFVESVWLELFTVEPPDELPQTSFADILANDGYNPEPLSGDTLILPGGKVVEFDFTDDNTNETLIIKSNERTYHGVSETSTYFSVTNTSDKADEIQVQAYFPSGVGEVTNLEVFNQNKPLQVTIPEYRPYVYHCEAGWEYAGEFTENSLQDLSRQLIQSMETEFDEASSTEDTLPEPVFDVPTTPTSSLPTEVDGGTTTNTTTVMRQLLGVTELLQLSTIETIDETATNTIASTAVAEDEEGEEPLDLVAGYACRNTNVVRQCDELDGDNTACRVNQVKVREHEVTNYAPGWEKATVNASGLPEPGFFARAVAYIGFGPRRKDVPEEFEARVHTPDMYNIQPGETLYFKMDIAFPPFSTGEYWIEAVGDSEYGLLDPFWSSQWIYRLPITIDNTANATTLTEQQVFLELDSSLTDFWSNVKDDGGDIRFIQETIVGNEEDWYGTGWGTRTPITIQASQVDADITDFPVYVDLSDLGASFFSSVQADGSDIRVTTDDGITELPYELVSISTGGQTGQLHFKAGSISSTTNTTFYIYHDNPNVNGYSETDTYGARNVWSSEYLAVYHLEEEAAGRGNANLYQDSTSNQYDADDELNSTGKTGQLGQGQEIDAQGDFNEYMLLPSDIVTGETELYFSYWMNSTESNDQALLNGGPNNEYLLFLTNGGTTLALYDGSNVNVTLGTDLSNGTWRHVVVTRDTNNNQWRVFVDGQQVGTASDTMSPLVTPPNCLVVGLEQDGPCLSSGSASQHLNAFIDEMRFRNTIPSDAYIAATYENQASTTSFYSVGTVDTLTITNFSELDHWVQHFSTTTEEADIWVQVDSLAGNASTTVYLYYGNSSAVSASNEYAPFTYSAPRDLYYVVNPSQTNPIVVYSLIDNNQVSIDGGTPVFLDSGESTSFATYASTSVISAQGPITARTTDDSSEPPVPIAFATTTHITTTNRNNEDFYVLAPFATATVSVFEGANVTATASSTVGVGASATYNVDLANNADFGIIESDEPILLYHNNDTDSYVAYPPTTRDLYGIYSQNYLYGSISGGAEVAVYCSNGNNGTTTGMTRGGEETNSFCGGGSNGPQGTGNAIRLTNASHPIGATQEADGDGNESSRFLPPPEFGTRYILPQAAQYISVACAPRFGVVNIEVQDTVGNTVSTGTCTPSGQSPGALNITPGTPFIQGYQVVSTNQKPFYVYYEDNGTGDETNTWSAVQARAFNSLDAKPYSVGAQEINIDAEYEQLSFAWYENENAETPTTLWSIGGSETVIEGENITGQGAVNDGDVVRLRMNLLANVATGSASSTAFALQYAAAQTCSTASSWQEIGKVGSTTAAFSGFNNSSLNDGQTLTSVVLASSTVFGTYEEASLSEFIPNDISPGEVAEWDWVITSSNATVNTNYCFRMIRSSGEELLGGYNTYPQLLTSGPPQAPTLLKRFDNEHANSLRPTFEFVANDASGDDLQYQIQIALSTDFISDTVLDQDSATDFLRFENVSNLSDKEPFTSGQTIRYTPAIDLTSSTTYWWRVRAIDPAGSNTYSEWSTPFSFTINESLIVSEWYQTTDEQFETNSLISATTSGSGSVELDIGSSNIGEYGSLEIANNATTTITFNNTYTDPIVVASLRYPRSVANGDQVIPRVVSKSATEFDVITRDDGNDATGSSTLDYLVMEVGEYIFDDGAGGTRIFATSTLVTGNVNGAGGNPANETITFPTSFSSNPMVMALVTSNNDPNWIVPHVYSGGNDSNPPSASEVSVYLSDNRYPNSNHQSSETVDIIAMDFATGTVDGIDFAATSSGATNVTDVPFSIGFSPSFSSAPGTVLAQKLTNTGADGGYAMLDTDNPVTAADATVAIDEGAPASDNRDHGAAEEVAVLAFGATSGNIVRSGNGQIVSTPIDFDDADVGNAWGEFSFNDSGDVTYHVEYQTGGGFTNIPDSALPGNSAGLTSSPVNILSLDTDIYNEIRLVATMSGVGPELFDWRVTWGQRVDIPTLGDPFDNEKIATTTPTFDFMTTDPQGDALEYEISWGTDKTFLTGVTTRNSSTSPDFSPGHPYPSGDTVTFTIPPGDTLTDGETYWWRVRAKDPSGADSWSPWSEPDSFTVDTATVVSTWFQTSQEQFTEGVLNGVIASTSDAVIVPSSIGLFGTTTLNNSDWITITLDKDFNDMVVVAKPSYDFDTNLENFRIVRVRNKTTNSFEIRVETESMPFSGSTTVDYVVIESGDWVIDDGSSGLRVIADTVENVSDRKGNVGYANGTFVSFSPAFTGSDPGAILTITSDNGSKWVAASMDHGLGATNSPDNDINPEGMFVGLEISVDSDTARAPEDIDYIAFSPGLGTNNSTLFDFFNSGDVVRGSEGPDGVNYNQSFTSAPGIVLAQVNGMDGGQGGSVIQETGVASTNTTGQFMVVEMPSDNGHTAEVISIMAFESESGEIIPDNLGGTITSEPVLFSDGFGPKFERALFSTTSPGNSSISIQIQYQTATGSWALIPDTQIAGNSSGNTLSPIDLTGVDIATYQVVRFVATLLCDGVDCPTLEDWSIEWSEGVPISGTIAEYDRTTPVTSGTVRVAVNGVPGNTGSIAGDGTWSINNVTALAGQTVTVWVDGAATDADKAVAVFTYDGVGDMTGIELFEQHLTISADENGTTTNADLADYDNSVSGNADIFFDVDGNNDLQVCAISGCSEANLYIGPGDIYIPDTGNSGNVTTHDFINDGRFELDGNTMRVSGSWDNNATTDMTGSTVIFTATTGNETVDELDNLLNFNNLTFGETSGTATWQTFDPLDVNGALVVNHGTLNRASSTIAVAGNLTTGASGFWSGVSTTTFDGNSTAFWSDTNPVKQDVGHVIIDGGTKSVFLSSDVLASNLTIGANDTLNAGGANTLNLTGNFTNTGTFLPQTGTVAIVGTSTNAIITVGGSSLRNLTASSTGGSVSFTNSNITLLGDLTIATGTVNLATAITTINGSFSNTGGNFAHNNAEVRFTSTNSETVELQGTQFLNHFYNVRFTGSGDWTFLDTNATTTNTWTQSNGTVVMPSGTLTVGRDFTTSGSGAFDANGGEVIFLTRSNDPATTNGSAFNDVRIREGTPVRGGEYPSEWLYRDVITIDATYIDEDLTNFPVYLDLADFSSDFFANINSNGGDIRITTSDGITEVPREVVSASTTAKTGEVYFQAPTLSSITNSTFYLYYGNATATEANLDPAYAAENVWNDDYEAVYHLEETGSTYLDSTSNSVDGVGEGTLLPAAVSGRFGTAQSITNGRIDIGTGLTSVINVTSEYTISTWINQNTSAGDQSLVAQFTGAGDLLFWGDAGSNPGFCNYMGDYMPSDCQTVTAQTPGTWQNVVARYDGTNGGVQVNGSLIGAGMTAGNFSLDPSLRWSIGTAHGDTNTRQFNGLMDEVRISSIDRGEAWIDAEYRNMASSSHFYTVTSGSGGTQTRVFAEGFTTAIGDVVIESGAVQFPSGTFNIGGSFDNDGTFFAGSGLVNFNSTSSAETIAAGASSNFHNLSFNGVGGQWTIIENATATDAINLTNADTLTVNTGIVLESTGTFTNDLANASTTWDSGSILLLSSGNDITLNDKTNDGDDYNILTVTGNGTARMWNSTAATYDTQDTSSIYSQDHDGNNGDLYIFGGYVRETGTEHWSYATDFDGVSLTGGDERQVNVRVANGASVTASSSSAVLSIIGTSTASTTVNAQSGAFTLIAQTATLTASYFEMTGTDANGFQLLGSTTVAELGNAEFTIPAASAAITVDATTVDHNPEAQYFNTDFVTGAGTPVNVALSGSPSSFWWFRDGAGDRYGEAFDDAGDGNPGSIQWDDSNFQITVSGTVYSDDGVSTMGVGTCDGLTNNVRIVVDDNVYTDAVPCDGSGNYTFNNVSYNGDANIVVYLDTNGGTQGTVVTRTPTGDITDLDLYANRVIVRHENTAKLSIADMTEYDNDDDSDIAFTASTSTSPDSLNVLPGTGLYVWDNDEFVPNGTVTLQGGGNYLQDGSLDIGPGATYTSNGTNAITIGGSLFVDSGGVFAGASSTVTFTATNTAQQIGATGSSTITFYNLEFTGAGGGWAVQTPIISTTDILVSDGTVSGVSNITVQTGKFTGEGSVDMTGGTVTINRANTLGGSGEWNFFNLTLGNGVNSEVTVRASNATTTVRDTLTIATGHFLNAYGSIWDLQGDGLVMVENGTFIQGTSTVRFSGATPDITQTPYYNLVIDSDTGPSTVATAPITGLQVQNNLTVGALSTTTLDLDTNDPILGITGDLYIGPLGTIEASNSNIIDIFGNWDNDGTFNANGGTVEFENISGTAQVAAGASPFANVQVLGDGLFEFTESATATDSFNLNAGGFTLNPGSTLAVGGPFTTSNDDGDTTWVDSTLRLYGGGAYNINNKNTSDTYDTIVVDGATHPRLWNSTVVSVVTLADSSLYSRDHAGVDGELYIYGHYQNNSFDDVWSYAADFDGASLSGGNERQVDVYFIGSSTRQVEIFTSDDTFVPPAGVTEVDVLVVAGGGGGGSAEGFSNAGGGGGGAGGLIYETAYSVTPLTPVALTVGAGGAAGSGGNVSGTNGENSTFGPLTALGGGGGAGGNVAGNAGGSGGGGRGAAGGSATQPGSPDGGFGNDGATWPSATGDAAGGGGGAGAPAPTGPSTIGGDGGDGLVYSITGASTTYAGGGAGGGAQSSTPGTGGAGGGGNGGNDSTAPTAGAANTGGGGGGGNNNRPGAAGGSGIVIVSYVSSAGMSVTDGSLTILGTATATTTVQSLSPGSTYNMTLGGTATVDLEYYQVRDTTAEGLVFTGEPTVLDISNGDFEVEIAGGSAITVGGTVIDENPALEFNFNRFATTTAINAFNVTATGTSVSAWRFVNVFGNLEGESKDNDPAPGGGDPGYITWEDSAAIINITGTVYSDEGISTSAACDGTTGNIRLSINGSTFATTTCDGDGLGGGTGDYAFTGISYGLGNTLTVYIDNEPENAVTVTQDPISSIANFDLYENRVIIKHEGAAPMTIADMGTWDSDNDPGDVLFDVETTGGNSLTLPADTKLIVWNNKEFEPQGDVIIPGGGSGAAFDGTLELRNGATFSGADSDEYTIGGSLLAGTGATFVPAQSTTTFTTTGAGRTIDTNGGGFYNVQFTGSGSWTVSDTDLNVGNDLIKSAGALTLSTGTTTVGGSFTNAGGTFDANGGTLHFTATDAGNDVTLGGSDAHSVRFAGVGDWSMSDTSATATASFVVATGTVTLSSGVLTVGDDFLVEDTIVHNSGLLRLVGTGGGNVLTLSNNDLNDVLIVAGAGDYTQTDAGASLLGDLIIESGTYTAGTSTLSIGGSFDATGGTFVNNNGSVLFNSNDTGEIVDPGTNEFHNVTFAGSGGGWTVVDNATSTNNFTINTGASFTQSPGTVLYVSGVFTNTLGGSATEWSGSTLVLDSGTEYEINLKSTPTERYDNLLIGTNTDISAWNTSATSTSVPANSSLYSQDHAGVDGNLYIYGDYHIATTTEHWSYNTDFDGTAPGVPRAVSVAIADGSTITVEGGTLNLLGAASASTSVSNQGSGTYTFAVTAGTFNANYYSFRNLDTTGLQLSGTPTITSLSRGDFELADNNDELITLASTTLDANASLLITNTRFDSAGFTGGRNVTLDATTTNSWNFTGAIGDLWGEDFDVDGSDKCSSIRWDDSECLLTEQINYRWRNDDGGEGASPGTWYDSNWGQRQRIRVINDDPQTYTNAVVKLDVNYDGDMQPDYEDLRFTDASGTALIDFWIERFTSPPIPGAQADVWVEIPELATSSVAEIYMYYGNVSASASSSVDAVFLAADDFEDNNISEYEGGASDLGRYITGGTYAYGGSFGLQADPAGSRADDGIARNDITVQQGEIIRYMQYVNLPAGNGDEVCTLFGVQDTGPNPPAFVTYNDNYAVCLSPLRSRVSINRDIERDDSNPTNRLASAPVTFATGWYEVEVDWQTDDTIDVTVWDNSGGVVATTSATDSTYTSGGIGFTHWFQNGGWDSFVSRPRTDSRPTVLFGAEQTDGGASWAAPQDTPTGGFLLGQTARLRIGVENTGLPITDQNFRLEFAPKLAAPTCSAVSGGSYVAVPSVASCGVSEICMATSTNVTNGDATTDHLVSDASVFVPGTVVANTSNQSTNLDVSQNEFTELEYVIKLTTNALNDAYCFRVTDAGATLDSYALLPELTLAFDPVLDTVVLNDGFDISLTPGTTTTVIASTTVTDFNGVSDLAYATTTFYKTSVNSNCTPDNNNCYVVSGNACTFTLCDAVSCTLNCSAEFQFHADPTNSDGAEEWFAFVEVQDTAGGVDIGSSLGVEVLEMNAIGIENDINYGTLDVNQTSATNPEVVINNLGNTPVDVQISGSDMTDGSASIIPASQQIFATSSFSYSSCVSCNTLSVTGNPIDLDLTKPVSDSPLVSDQIYWGIEVPFGTASNPHTGQIDFMVIPD